MTGFDERMESARSAAAALGIDEAACEAEMPCGMPVREIGVYGRSAQGVRLVRLSEGAKLVSVSVCESEGEGAADAGSSVGNDVNDHNDINKGENE